VGSRTSSHAQEAKGRRERRRKERTASSRTPNPTITPEIKMVVSEWYTDELGNRARMIYNAKTADFETPYDLSRGFSLA
jgi:hypothetical protein